MPWAAWAPEAGQSRDLPAGAGEILMTEPLAHRLTVENQTIHHDTDELDADVAVTLTRASMIDAIAAPDQLDAQIETGAIIVDSGDVEMLKALLGALDIFGPANLIEP